MPEAEVQPSRDGMVSGTWVAACAFRWDVVAHGSEDERDLRSGACEPWYSHVAW